MKTTKITKRQILQVLRAGNVTEIFRVCKKKTGSADYNCVYDFINKYAPTKAIRRKAFNMAYQSNHKFRNTTHNEILFPRNELANRLRRLKKDGVNNYSKTPFLGYTHLYLCSPWFGHSDYNKCRFMPIAGNEEFCELAVRIAQKIELRK